MYSILATHSFRNSQILGIFLILSMSPDIPVTPTSQRPLLILFLSTLSGTQSQGGSHSCYNKISGVGVGLFKLPMSPKDSEACFFWRRITGLLCPF